jgi:hypothetical protein
MAIAKPDLGRWARLSERIVLGYLWRRHPEPTEILTTPDPPRDREDFGFVWEGTLVSLKEKLLVRELRRDRESIFRKFALTPKGARQVPRAVAALPPRWRKALARPKDGSGLDA